jgi:hypothetical protein
VDDATRSVASLESPGNVAGTLAYMSPEALRGAGADPRSDVWSLGVLFHEMASGRRPFVGRSGVDLTSSIIRDAPAPLSPSVPRAFAAVVEHCLQKEPARRYANAGEVRAALVAVQAASTPLARPGAAGRRRVAALMIGAIVALGAVLAFVWQPWQSATAEIAWGGHVQSLAVLPLEDLSGDTSQAYFAEGLTEKLINRLPKCPASASRLVPR